MQVCKSCRDKIRKLESNMLTPERGRARRNPTRWFSGLEGYPDKEKLLTTSSAKTTLGEALGYLSGVLYMMPVQRLEEVMRMTTRGKSRCAAASAGCAGGCLIVTGQGGGVDGNVLRRARKTWLYEHDRKWFMAALERSIAYVVRLAESTTTIKEGKGKGAQEVPFIDPLTGKPRSFIPCIRLNGTTDILWENPQAGVRIMDLFPNVVFYDYTKWPLKKRPNVPDNYDLTFSWSDNKGTSKHALEYLRAGYNVAVVWRTLLGVIDVIEKGKWKYRGWKKSYKVINGDRDDLRFLDPHPCIVALYAKTSMLPELAMDQRADPFGFFMERMPEQAAYEGWTPPPPYAIDPESPYGMDVWEDRCTEYERVCVPDPRDPLGQRKITVDMCTKTRIPYDTPVHASVITAQKKAWTKKYYGAGARHLTAEGMRMHKELVEGSMGRTFATALEEQYGGDSWHGVTADQRSRSRLTDLDGVLRALTITTMPTKKWMDANDHEAYMRLKDIEKRIRSKTAANKKRRKADKRLRQDLLVMAYMEMNGIDASPEFFRGGAVTSLAERALSRPNPRRRR
jgi:hypothetical protein